MLTPQDIITISNLLDKKLDEKLDNKFREHLDPIHKKIDLLQRDITKVKKDLLSAIRLFDNDIYSHDRRITKLETCCNIVADE